jgi:gluconate kinase
MILKEVLDAVVPLDDEQRVRWLIELGSAMTISARAG